MVLQTFDFSSFGGLLAVTLEAIKQGDKVKLLNSKSEFLQAGVVSRQFSDQLS